MPPRETPLTRRLVRNFKRIARSSTAKTGDKVRNYISRVSAASGDMRGELIRSAFRATQLTKRQPQSSYFNAHNIAMMALAILFEKHPFDPDYKKYMQERSRVLVTKLMERRDIADAYKEWKNYTDDNRVDTLNTIMELMRETFSNQDYVVSNMEWGGLKKLTKGINAEYREGKMYFNVDQKENWDDFITVFKSTIHENMHHFHMTALNLKSNQPPAANSVFFKQALLFDELKTRSGDIMDIQPEKIIYLTPEDSYSTYIFHPFERDARETAINITNMFSNMFSYFYPAPQ